MKKLMLAAVTVTIFISPASAFYTQCTVTKEVDLLNRPDGNADPRAGSIDKGENVAYRDEYQDWWFVLSTDSGKYGWVPKKVVTKCKKVDGTP